LSEFLINEWLPAIKGSVRVTTWDSYEGMLRRHVLPTLGGLPLRAISPSHLNALYADLATSGNHRTKAIGGLQPDHDPLCAHDAQQSVPRRREVGPARSESCVSCDTSSPSEVEHAHVDGCRSRSFRGIRRLRPSRGRVDSGC